MRLLILFALVSALPCLAFDSSIRNTCESTDPAIQTLFGLSDADWKLDPDALLKRINQDVYYYPYEWSIDAWYLLTTHRFNVRKAAYLLQVQSASYDLKRLTGLADAENELERLKNTEWTYPEESKKFTRDTVTKVFAQTPMIAGFDKFLGPACAQFASLGCKAAAQEATKMMHTVPHDIYFVSGPKLIETIFTDEIYGRAMINVAHALHQRVKQLQGDNQTTSADRRNVFDMLTEEFERLGLNANDAHDHAMTVMGLYGTRGASTSAFYPYVTKGNYMAYLAIQIISAAISTLDYENARSTGFVSLPREIQSSCMYGKPYHFWLAAYLSHSLVKAGHKPKAVFYAVHLLTVAYQLFMKTGTRSEYNIFTYKADSPEIHYFRSTVIFDDAGALWGTKRNWKNDWNLDPRHRSLLTHYRDQKLTEYSDEKAERIIRNKPLFYVVWSALVQHFRGLRNIRGNID